MKKLFVLFLLAALVPFTVGCGLFGDNDDTTPVNLTRLSASATLPVSAASNLRGAAVAANTFRNFVMTINGVELVAETEENVGRGNYTVNFGAIVSNQQAQLARAGRVPVLIKATRTSATPIIQILVETTSLVNQSLNVAVTGTPGNYTVSDATIGETTLDRIVIAADKILAKIVNVTPVNSGLQPSFDVTFDNDIFGVDFTDISQVSGAIIDVKARRAGGEYLDANAEDFNYSYNKTTKKLTVALVDKTLTAGRTYEVAVRTINYNGNYVAAYVYTFTATASTPQ